MQKRITWLLSIAITVVVFIGAGYIALLHSQTQVHTLINQSLQEAERLHYNDRLNAFSRNPHIYVDPALKAYLFAPVSSRKIKSYTLQTTEGKTTYLFKDSIPEEKARKLLNEYLLADIQPVRVEEVNRLFQEQLEKRHVSGTAGVFYSDKSARTRTRAGILPTPSAYKTPVCWLDLTHSLQLQGWVDYDWLTLLRHIHAGFYGLLCWNKLFDIRLFRDKGVHFDETMFFGDDASELHRVYDGEYVYCVPRVLYHYRRRGGQMTEVLFPPRRLDDLKMYWNWLGWFAAQPDKTEYKGYYEWAVAWYWKVFYLFWCQASEARAMAKLKPEFLKHKKHLDSILPDILRCPHVPGAEKARAVLFCAAPGLTYTLAHARGKLHGSKTD